MKIYLFRFLQEIVLKLILICLLIIIGYSLFSRSIPVVQTPQKSNRTKFNAFIITADCNSLRFNVTKENIERVFPNFFNILCYLSVPFNDSRIHPHPLVILKKFSSHLLTFLDLWTYKIPNESNEWIFIFEDDVNFMNSTKVSLPNYIEALQELMYNPEVQNTDGFLYLGICGATFHNDSQPLISKNTNNSLISQRGCGTCLHASGITAKRAQFFWTEVSSYRPDLQVSLDKLVQNYCNRSKNYFYTLGTNFHYAENHGIAYQDHSRFPSTVI